MTAKNERVAAVLRELSKKRSRRTRDEMLTRYGITAPKAFGVPVGVIKAMGKKLGTDHELALALWDTGWYEARLPPIKEVAEWAGEFRRFWDASYARLDDYLDLLKKEEKKNAKRS